MILADKIIALRKKHGMSQEELAEKINVSRQSVSKWEGAQSIPDLDRIIQLSQLFGVSTDYLLTGDIVDKDQLLLSDKMRKLNATQFKFVERIIDDCIDYFEDDK